MPNICYIPGCNSRSNRVECKDLSFFRIPADPELSQRWLVSVKRPINVSSNTRVCSLHFEEGKPTSENPLPTVFCWSQSTKKRHALLEREDLPPRSKRPNLINQVNDVLGEVKVLLNEAETQLAEKQKTVDELTIKLSQAEYFGISKFTSDHDIRFYTGLPSYSTFLCIYRYLQPLLSNLRYRNDYSRKTSLHRNYKPRPRALEHIDEFFLVLMRLRLCSLEEDLAHRFSISIATVSRICTTWIRFLNHQLRPLISWPSRASTDLHMPTQFKELYPCILE